MKSKHHPSHSHPPSSQSRDWEHSQTTLSSPFHCPLTTPSPTPPALSALHSPSTAYRFLVQLHLLIDASQIRQLRLTQRVVTETTVLATRTVVRDVEKHTPHFLRVVTVDATPLLSHPHQTHHPCRNGHSSTDCSTAGEDLRGGTRNPCWCNDRAGRTDRAFASLPSCAFLPALYSSSITYHFLSL